MNGGGAIEEEEIEVVKMVLEVERKERNGREKDREVKSETLEPHQWTKIIKYVTLINRYLPGSKYLFVLIKSLSMLKTKHRARNIKNKTYYNY